MHHSWPFLRSRYTKTDFILKSLDYLLQAFRKPLFLLFVPVYLATPRLNKAADSLRSFLFKSKPFIYPTFLYVTFKGAYLKSPNMDYLLVIHLLIPCNYCTIQSRLKTALCFPFKCILREF